MCNANTMQEWVLSNKDAVPAKNGEKRVLTGALVLMGCLISKKRKA